MEDYGVGWEIADKFALNVQADVEPLVSGTNLFLDHVVEVVLTSRSDGLSWKLLESPDDDQTYLGLKQISRTAAEVRFSDIYAVEFMHCSNHMYHFSVHSFEKSKSQPSLWTLVVYTFSHKDMDTCQMWVHQINASLNKETGRPKNLLVFVNPLSGKANGCMTWETVAPIFSRAKVNTQVVVTERAGHASDVMASMAVKDLKSYDGVLVVGGDGFFNEILNGFLLSRHKAPNLPTPSDFFQPVGTNDCSLVNLANEAPAEHTYQDEDQSPFLACSSRDESGLTNLRSEPGLCDPGNSADQDHDFPIPSEQFRFGIIPAGSTDTIAMCTTGARDPITSSLHIVLGKRVCLDIARVVRWKTTSTSAIEPFVRYAASFAGYGFYGDVITESEKYRYMGPKRYHYAGTQVFLKHRSYEAEVAYLEVESEKTNLIPENGRPLGRIRSFLGQDRSDDRLVCRRNCTVCNTNPDSASTRSPNALPYSLPKGARWLKSRGNFLSVGAAIISNRSKKAPDGLVADAHLSDGFLHLILIRNCSRASYLWHLTQLAMRGGKPLNFEFVEHHKTPAFTFTSFGDESVWNLDGEVFQAHQLSAQVFRGLISFFASGPEV